MSNRRGSGAGWRHPAATRCSLGAVAAAVLTTACASVPSPPRPPAPLVDTFGVTVSRWVGGVLSGPAATGRGAPRAELDAAPREVRVTIDALAAPLPGGAPLARRARLGADLSGAVALSLASPLLVAGRVAAGGDAIAWERILAGVERRGAPRSERLAVERATLWPGTTVVVSVGAIGVEVAPGDFLNELARQGPYPQRLDVLVGLGPSDGPPNSLGAGGDGPGNAPALELAVAVLDRDRTGDAADSPTPRASAVGPTAPVRPMALRRDLVRLVDRPTLGGASVAVLVPNPLRAGRADAAPFLLVQVDELPSSTEPVRLAAERAAFGAAERAFAAVAAAPDARWREDEDALTAIRSGEGRRTALLRLADTRGAALAGELALVLADADLAAYAERLAEAAPGPELAWALERAALLHASALLASVDVPPALESALVRHAGQAGRFAAVLEEAALGSPSVSAVQARFVQENLIALEDSDPAARVRAHRWLVEQGAAPSDFEPLAAREVRRAVLRAARERAAGADGQPEVPQR